MLKNENPGMARRTVLKNLGLGAAAGIFGWLSSPQ